MMLPSLSRGHYLCEPVLACTECMTASIAAILQQSGYQSCSGERPEIVGGESGHRNSQTWNQARFGLPAELHLQKQQMYKAQYTLQCRARLPFHLFNFSQIRRVTLIQVYR